MTGRKLLRARMGLAAVLLCGFVSAAQAFVLAGTAPGKWGTPGFGTPGGVVTWSLMASGTSCVTEGCIGGSYTALSAFMPAGFHTAIVSAFSAWSSVANISFMEVVDDGLPFNVGASGMIRIGGESFDGAGGTLAHGYFPPVNGATAAGDIHFDVADAWKIGFGGSGFDIFQVMAHEIGHAIGLDHTGVSMSLMNPFYTEAFAGLQADDIAGAQFIYGAAAVPEPETYAMLLAGLGLLGLASRRRKQRAGRLTAS